MTAYKVKVSADNSRWQWVQSGALFGGNVKNNNRVVYSKFSYPVKARYVRIIVWSWKSHISLRASVRIGKLCKGLDSVPLTPSYWTTRGAQFTDGVITVGKGTAYVQTTKKYYRPVDITIINY